MAGIVAAARQERTAESGTWIAWRAWVDDVAVFAVYLALAFVVFAPIWLAGGATHMPAGGDQWRNVWFNEWTLRAATSGHNAFFSNAANYPGGVNVLINAGAPLLSVLFIPVTLMFGPIAAFNLTLTLAMPLSAIAAYVLIKRVVGWRPAAILGGLLYGFGPEEMAHGIGQVNLSFTPLVPLIVLCVYELVVEQRGRAWPWGAGLGLLVSAQFFLSSEVLLETVLVSAAAVGVAAVLRPGAVLPRFSHAARGIGIGAGVALVLLAWPVWFLVHGPAHVSGPVQLPAQSYRSNPLALILPDSSQLFSVPAWRATADRFANGPVENGSYLGVPLLVALLAGLVWCRREKTVLVAALAGVVAFILSLGASARIHAGTRIPLPETVLGRLPLLENLTPSRFALQMTLSAAVAGAFVMAKLHDRWKERGASDYPAKVLLSAVGALALAPLLPAHLVPGVERDGTPAGFTALASNAPKNSVAVVFPFASGSFPDPILWQTDAKIRFKMPGGSFFVPEGPDRRVAYSTLLGYTYDSATAEALTGLAAGTPPERSTDTKAALASEWNSWRVDSVLAVPAGSANPTEAMSFLTWLLGPPSAQSGSTYAWYHVHLSG